MGMDVSIVGAGPVGCFLAGQLKDLEVSIYEEHAEAGKLVQCAGLISKNVDELVKVPEDCILNTVKGARFYSPSGSVAEFSREEDQAYVIDRALFDKSLAEDLDIEFNTRINSLDFDSKFVIGSDGSNSKIAELAGFPKLKEVLLGVQYVIENREHGTDFVEVYVGNNVAPGFFAWVVPAGDKLRIGLATNGNSRIYLDKFMESKFSKAEILEKNAGLIPVKPREPFVKGNIALVGDAAGQVKPSTGGGVYMGLKSAKVLADAIKANDLDLYTDEWNKQVRSELVYGSRIREIMKNLSDNEFDKIMEFLAQEDIKKLLEEHGDIDKPSLLVKGVLKNPKLLTLFPYLRYLWG